MRKFIFVALAFTSIMCAFAQSDSHHQLLIFRKTGVTDIVYTDNLKSIELSRYDSDSIEHTEYVSQVFRRITGGDIIVPIADIDSVAFGARKIIEPKPGVRRMTDAEAYAITEFSDSHLYYPSATNSSLMVTPGETVYYDAITPTLPYGLCAKIGEATSTSSGTRYAIEFLDPADVFNRFFISENSDDTPAPDERQSRVTNDEIKSELFRHELSGSTGKVKYSLTSEVEAGLEANECVFDAIRHRYHAKITLHVEPKISVNFKAEKSVEQDKATDPKAILRFPALFGALSFALEGRLFYNMLAEVACEWAYTTKTDIEFEWTRENGVNTFSDVRIADPGTPDSEHKTSVIINGDLFAGPELDVVIGGLWDRVGAAAAFKVGPFISGELGVETLHRLAESYEYDSYCKGSITGGLRCKMETFTFTNLSLGGTNNRDYYKLPFEHESEFSTKINLFPDLHTHSTKGKAANQLEQTEDSAVDVSSHNGSKIEVPVDVEYQLKNKETDEVIQEIIVETPIEAKTEEPQQIFEEFILDETTARLEPEKLEVQPIINYADFKIKAMPDDVAGDMVFSPVNAVMHNSGHLFVTGMTPVSQHDYEHTTYIEGNILPYIVPNNPYRNKRTATVASWIVTGGGSNTPPCDLLTGRWSGIADGATVIMEFIDGTSGTYDGTSFTYETNSPSLGGLLLKLANGKTVIMYLISIDDQNLTVTNNARTKLYQFQRQ